MKELMKTICHIMATDGRSIEGRALKTAEETGELSEAVLSYTGAPGCEYKNKTVDDIISEAADVVICALSVAIHAAPTLEHNKFMHVIDKKLHKWNDVVEKGRVMKIAAEDEERGTGGLYFRIWVHEESKWYYFKDAFDGSNFKNGYVAYTIKVEEGIIVADDYKTSNVGKPFVSMYAIRNWEEAK